MVPKSRKKKAPAAMSQKEFKAALRRIDANLRKGKEMDRKIASDLEALRRLVEDE